MTDTPATTAVRVCVYGGRIAEDWLAALRSGLPPGTPVDLAGDAPDGATAGAASGLAASAIDVLHSAASRAPGADVVVVRAGTALPARWYERLLAALAIEDVLVVSPLDNLDASRSPLPAGLHSDAPAAAIDALCYLHGRRELVDTAGWSPLLSAWSASGLRRIDPALLAVADLQPLLAPLRAVMLDHLYAADPQRPLRGPALPAPGDDPPPPSALGELRESVAAALDGTLDGVDQAGALPGLDGRPVVLHVLHGWGGGSERFVRDLAGADRERHHLVLVARGDFRRRSYGEVLELFDHRLADPPLRRCVLAAPIRSTALSHRGYEEFLRTIVADFGVDAIVVSSLIGHSLDALRSGLPTLIVGHDFYPLWPVLHRDFGDQALPFDAAQRAADLAAAGPGFEFAERDPRYWQALRDAYVEAALAARAQLAAPSRSMLANLLRIEPRFAALRQQVVAHGLAPWSRPPVATSPPPRPRLRLLVVGRVRAGKGAALLRDALAPLRAHAEIVLLGAGAEGEQFFGERDVHIVLNYRRDDLPRHVEWFAPDVALLLPTVAETFSYALSELHSLGVPVVATRVGALAERIRDGVDGWLADPSADAVVAKIAELAADRDAIERARTELRALPARTLEAMAADYRRLLPLAGRPGPRYRLAAADGEQVLAQTRAALIGDGRREIDALRARIREHEAELVRRGDWGSSLDRELGVARERLRRHDQETAKRLAGMQQELERLTGELDERTRRTQSLDIALEERTRWAKSLDAQIEQMRTSRSWRLTRPLRFAARVLRALAVRAGFTVQRLRSIVRRTRGSLARRGLAGTLRRIGDEFSRRGGAPPAAIAAPLPDARFEPFALPVSDAPRVSIVIPVHNKVEYTIACLASIGVHAGTAPFEVIVVDDASTDATAERLARVGGIAVVRNAQNLGFVGSCNAGAARARGEFVLFLNNDTVVTAGWLEALLRCFEEQPDAGLVGAKLVYPDGRLQEAGGIVFSDASGWNYGRFDDPADPRYEFRREADYCSGAAILVRRELFERLGGFDVRYAPAYYEDTDLAFAIRAAGFKVYYEPRACVVHFEGVTAGTDTGSGMKRYQVVNREKFAAKWADALRLQPAPIAEAAAAPAAANHRRRGRVLIADSYTPTPDQDSGSLRMVGIMRLLGELGYGVAFIPDNLAHAGAYTQALQALGVEALYHPFVSSPVAWLREHGRSLAVIVLSRHYVALNYLGAVRLYAPQARLVFDTVDLHYLREERAAALQGSAELARHAAQTKRQETRVMRDCDITLVVSAAEKRLLEGELPGVRVEVLSNVHAVHGSRKAFAERRDLVFVGGFQHPPNIDAVRWFVGEVMPRLRDLPEPPRLHVIGSKAPPEVLALAADDVVVHGFVPDIAPFMDDCRLSIAPLRYGAGVKGKVNMAMSYGLPVVATSVAVEGMHVRPDVDVLVADSAEDFAAAIARGYGDAALWQTLSDNGLANVREHFSFAAARAALLRILA